MSFYLSFFIFILSLIAALALMIAGKNMPRDKFLLLVSFHGIFLFAFLASLVLRKENTGVVNNYFFTAYICSGLILSGLSWRSHAPFFLRIYFSVFALTIPLFMFSPSMLLNFLLTTNYSGTSGVVFHLKDQYYLERQNTTSQPEITPHYKVIIKRGMFHQTVMRDIDFSGTVDSVKVIDYNKEQMTIRGYSSKQSYVSTTIDSADANIVLRKKKASDVEYRL